MFVTNFLTFNSLFPLRDFIPFSLVNHSALPVGWLTGCLVGRSVGRSHEMELFVDITHEWCHLEWCYDYYTNATVLMTLSMWPGVVCWWWWWHWHWTRCAAVAASTPRYKVHHNVTLTPTTSLTYLLTYLAASLQKLRCSGVQYFCGPQTVCSRLSLCPSPSLFWSLSRAVGQPRWP